VPILPDQFATTPVRTLLLEAEKGLIGFDRRLIQSLLDRREETIAALVKYAAEEHEESLLDLTEQIFDLFRALRAPEAMPFYIQLLKKRGDAMPDELVEACGELGAAAVEPLLELHEESNEDDRPDLVFLLVTLGVRDARIRALVEEALAVDPYEGALCAGLYGDPALKPAVEAALGGASSAEEEKVLRECLEALGQERETEPEEAFDILALYPAESLPLFDEILPEDVVPFLECADAEYRARAAASFADDEYPDEVRDKLFAMARNDADAKVRGSAWRALGERVVEEPVREALLAVLSEKRGEPEEWKGALIGLSGATMMEPVNEAILWAYEQAEFKAEALHTMWRSFDKRYKKFFAPNLKSEDLGVRRQAIQGVGAYPLTELSLELVPMLADEDVREEALFAYAMSVKHATTPKTANKLMSMIDEKAGGLSESEEEMVAVAIDRRLEREGFEPVFFPDDEEEHDHDHAPAAEPAKSDKPGRNDPCPCGSGKKYKKCCGQ